MEGSYWINHVAPEDPAMQPFFAQYKERWNDECKEFVNGVLGYDSVYWVVDAIARAGSDDPKAIRDALEATKDLKLHHATITMDPATHNPVDKDGVVLIAKGGKGRFFKKIKPTAHDSDEAEAGRQSQSVSERPEKSLFQMTLEKAEKGDPVAQYDLGELYFTGNGVPGDLGKSVEWYRKSADQGHPRAQFNLGWMYENGRGVPADEAKAAEWYRKAADQGDGRAKKSLERLLAASGKTEPQKEGVKEEAAPAVNVPNEEEKKEEAPRFNKAEVLETQRLLKQLGFEVGAVDGLYGSRTQLAIQTYQRNKKIAVDGLISDAMLKSLRRSVEEFQKKAEKEAQKQPPVQAVRQPETQTVELKPPIAVAENQKTGKEPAIAKEPPAQEKISEAEAKFQYQMGKMHRYRDGKKEFESYLIAAEYGLAVAQCALGDVYMNNNLLIDGKQVAPNYELGVHWYEKAANQGYIQAEYKLGWAYEFGIGVVVNKALAAYWYREAAERNHAEAQYRLGYFYSKGYGVPPNEQESRKWYIKSAKQGNRRAQQYLKLNKIKY